MSFVFTGTKMTDINKTSVISLYLEAITLLKSAIDSDTIMDPDTHKRIISIYNQITRILDTKILEPTRALRSNTVKGEKIRETIQMLNNLLLDIQHIQPVSKKRKI